MQLLINGRNLTKIFFPGDQVIEVNKIPSVKDMDKCIEIIVVMETGHSCMVPWIRAEFESGRVQQWNAALIEGVEL